MADDCSPEELAETARKGPEAPGGDVCLGPGCRADKPPGPGATLTRNEPSAVIISGTDQHRVIEQHGTSPTSQGGNAGPERGCGAALSPAS